MDAFHEAEAAEASKAAGEKKEEGGGEEGGEDDMFGEEKKDEGAQSGACKPFVGQIVKPSDAKDEKTYNKLPKGNLVLEQAFGFRCFYILDETRNCCKFTEDGKVAFITAALGVVMDPKTR